MLRIMLVLFVVAGPVLAGAEPLPEAISAPVQRLERIFGRGLILGVLKGQPQLVEQLVKAKKCTRTQLAEQTPAFEQAGAEVVQAVVDAVGAAIEKGQPGVVDSLVEQISARPFPLVLAYVPMAKLLAKRVRFEAQRGDTATLEKAAAELDAFVADQTKGRRDPAAWANSFIKSMGVLKFWDASAGTLMMAYTDVATPAQGARVDVNKATAAELGALPGIGAALGARIVAARTKAGGFDSLDDLAAIPGIGAATLASLRTAAVAGDLVHPAKAWTVLVYTACANNREWKGVHELNLMETVGSSDQVNVVVQLARIDGSEVDNADMPDDRSSGNWNGVRRFYVTRGKDLKNIESRRLASLGKIDMGSEKTLTEFFTWGIQHYPAQHYCLVVRNHGGGSTWGIASDDHFDSHISTPALGRSLAAARDAVRTATGDATRKLDLVCLQACLMGMVEIGWEMRDSVRYMLASEAVSPGTFGWDKLLADLVARPAADAREVAASMVKLRIDDIKGMMGPGWQVKFTLAAYDLDQLESVNAAMDRLGRAVQDHWPAVSSAFADAVAASWKFTDTSRDIGDLCRLLVANGGDPTVSVAAKGVLDALGYLGTASEQTRVALTSDKPGTVIWGVNGWTKPPQAIQPPGSKPYFIGNAIETSLAGPDAKGVYSAALPPFYAGQLGIRSIEYKLVGPRGGIGAEKKITDMGPVEQAQLQSKFGPLSPLIAEAHNGGQAGATGLAVVVVDPRRPKASASILPALTELKWDASNAWGQLMHGLLDGSIPAAGEATPAAH